MNSIIFSRRFFALAVLTGVMDLCFFGVPHAQELRSGTPVSAEDGLPLAEVRAIAKEAYMFLRLFWPKPEALDGKWKQPPLQRAE